MKINAEYCEVVFTVCGKNSDLAKILPKQNLGYQVKIPNISQLPIYWEYYNLGNFKDTIWISQHFYGHKNLWYVGDKSGF